MHEIRLGVMIYFIFGNFKGVRNMAIAFDIQSIEDL